MPQIATPKIPDGKLFIGGQWRESANGKFGATVNPATESEITQVARATELDVHDAVDAAYESLKSGEWRRMGPHERESVLHRIATLIDENADELAALEAMDVGKPVQFARSFDIQFISGLVRFCAGVPGGHLGGSTRPVSPSQSGQMPLANTRREPLGVIAAITPFNFPMILSATKIAPALAAGNSFVHKPASATPLTAIKMAQIFEQAGVPDGVFNLVTGSGGVVGNALVQHPKVKKIAFTGSTPVGKGILREGAETLKKVTLELGGKSAHIIFDDADMDTAIQHAMFAIFFNKGEFCMAGSRDNCANDITIGPEEGARLIRGGEPMHVDGKGFYFEPTILADVDNRSRVAHELKAGKIWVNSWGEFDSVLPFGGYKASGMGRELGMEAFESYTQTKSVYVDLSI